MPAVESSTNIPPLWGYRLYSYENHSLLNPVPMDKRNRFIALGAATCGMIGLLFWQDRMIDGQRETIFFHEKNIAAIQSQLQKEVATVTELRRENELIRAENQGLRDSIFWLENRVKELGDKLQFYERSLAGLRSEISKKDKFLAFLKEKLANLERNPAPKPAISPAIAGRTFGQNPTRTAEKPASLTDRIGAGFMGKNPETQPIKPVADAPKIEAAIAQTEREKSVLEEKAAVVESEKTATTVIMTEDKMRLMLNEKAQNLARTTTVKFSNILLKTEKAGRPIDQMDKDGKNWLITEMRIELSNPRPTMLSEQKFAVEIVDVDNGIPLPNIESNPAFPNSPNNSAGFTFQWRGAAIENTYFSRAQKIGKNYDLRVFYLFDGKKIPMLQATRPLLRDRKTV